VYTYEHAGKYTVTLTAASPTSADTKTKTEYIFARGLPEPDIYAYPRMGSAPLTVEFNPYSFGYATVWQWDFGDGNTSTEQYPEHIYTTAGTYDVSLNISDGVEYNTTAKPGLIRVTEQNPSVRNYNTERSYTSIQEAIDSEWTLDGHTIEVYSGTYYEDVQVSKAIILRGVDTGVGLPVLTGDLVGSITVTTDGAAVENFRITGNESYVTGIRVAADDATIINNTVIERTVGIQLISSGSAVRDNIVTGNSAYGILVEESDNLSITENTITGNSMGALFSSLWNSEISGNTVSGNEDDGFFFSYSDNITLHGNNVYGNGGGIWVFASGNSVLENNIISGNEYGMALYLSNASTITGNRIEHNIVHGIELWQSSQNLLYNNYFENTYNTYDDTGSNTWNRTIVAGLSILGGDWLGGNYWSDYDGVDTDGDGIGNTLLPYSAGIAAGGDLLPLTANSLTTGPIHNIDTGLNYSRIQDAIDDFATENGDTIHVESGFYRENVNVAKSLILIGVDTGSGRRVIDGSSLYTGTFDIPESPALIGIDTGDVFTLSADGITITGFETASGGGGGYGGYGIYGSTNGSTIEDNVVRGVSGGIYLELSSNNSITGNDVSECGWNGISLQFCHNNTIAINNLSDNGGSGLYLEYSSDNDILNNVASENEWNGIALSDSQNNIVTENLVEGNGDNGISFESANANIVTGNTIVGSGGSGIYLWFPQENSLWNNYLNNIENVYVNDYAYAYEITPINTWNITKTVGTNIVGGPYLAGNFWAAPNGTGFSELMPDADGDGICDGEYWIYDGNADGLPLGGVQSAPVANFTANVTVGEAPLTVAFSDTSTGNPEEWWWNFGDGNTSTMQNPVHVYAVPGTYSVTLEATNEVDNDSITREGYITVETPPAPLSASFTANVTSGIAPLTVRFSDTSVGEGIDGWWWEFGDEVYYAAGSSEQNPVHTYTEGGSYTVSLTVSNSAGQYDTREEAYYISVYPPYTPTVTPTPTPVPLSAGFTANVTRGTAPLAVRFSDTSTGEPEAWEWSFGDGNVSTVQNPVHVYAGPGTYTVALTVEGGEGVDTITRYGYITVETPVVPLSADFTANVTYGSAPLTVRFNDASTGEGIYEWWWDFGDYEDYAAGSSDQNPVHTYTEEGSYTVSLTVSNSADQHDTRARVDYISVYPPHSPTPTPTAVPDTGGNDGGGRSSGSPQQPPAAEPTPEVTPTPTPTPFIPTVNLTGIIDTGGVVLEPVEAPAFGGSITIDIDQGIQATNGGEPIEWINVEQTDDPAGGTNTFSIRGQDYALLSPAYSFEPSGTIFDPPIQIAFSYDGLLPEGMAPEDLVISYYDTASGTWVDIPTTVDTERKLVIGMVSHFSMFGVLGPAVPVVTPTPTETPTPAPEEAVLFADAEGAVGDLSGLVKAGGARASGIDTSNATKAVPAAALIPEEMVPAAAVATSVTATFAVAALSGLATERAGTSGLSYILGRLAEQFGNLADFVVNYFGEHSMEVVGEKEAEKNFLTGRVTGLSLPRVEYIILGVGAVLYGLAFFLADRAEFILLTLLIYVLVTGVAVAVHEITHHIIARKYGCSSQIKFYYTGILVTFATAWIFGNVFAQPLMTRITETGNVQKRDMGLVMLAGPAISIILAFLFLMLIPMGGIWVLAGTTGFAVNLLEGTYALVPFTPMDGKTIFSWNKLIWVVSFVPVITLYLILYVF